VKYFLPITEKNSKEEIKKTSKNSMSSDRKRLPANSQQQLQHDIERIKMKMRKIDEKVAKRDALVDEYNAMLKE